MPKNLTKFPGDVHIPGRLTVGEFDPPTEFVGDEHWDTADPLSADNQEHKYTPLHTQKHGTAVVAERRIIHVAQGTEGLFVGIKAGLVVPCTGNATITIDVLKNGVTALSSTIVLNSTHAAYDAVVGTVDSDEEDYVADDVFEVNVTVNAGTGALGQGLYVQTTFNEDAA